MEGAWLAGEAARPSVEAEFRLDMAYKIEGFGRLKAREDAKTKRADEGKVITIVGIMNKRATCAMM